MTKSDSAMEPRGVTEAGFTPKRRREAGTTLVEILVVIVIFLIGILAVVQVFPRGFRLLLTTRNNSMATALGRDQIEKLKSSPEETPEQILPTRLVGNNLAVDPTINPLDLGPLGDQLDSTGALTWGGGTSLNWQLASGPNRVRRIIGEGHRLPAARLIGDPTASAQAVAENYGSLLVLSHGPIEPGTNALPNIAAYGNDLSRTIGVPRDTAPATVASPGVTMQATDSAGNATSFTVSDGKWFTAVSTVPYEYFVVVPTDPTQANQASLLLPASPVLPRTYRIRVSAYVASGGGYTRNDFVSLSVTVPPIAEVANGTVNLVRVPFAGLIQNFGAVESETVRVSPQFVNVDNANRGSLKGIWSTPRSTNTIAYYQGKGIGADVPIDPFEYKVRDPYLGVLLFSPASRDGAVARPGGTSEPLMARVDYDVRDWRIIGEDFRVVDDNGTFALSLQGLKVGSEMGPDGIANRSMFGATNAWDPTPTPRDNVVIVDLTTGYEVQRASDGSSTGGRANADVVGSLPADSNIYVSVDKSRGSVTLRDVDPNVGGLQVRLIPPTGNPVEVSANNRTFRVLYRAKNEWAVQLLKGAAEYSVVATLPSILEPDQAYLPAGTGSKLYFPLSEVGHKVTIDRIAYYPSGSTATQLLEGQDFILRKPNGSEPSLAVLDLQDLLGNGTTFSSAYGTPVRGIKGASLTVRVLWNPESLSLGGDATANIHRLDEWGRGWRRSTTETYLRAEESR